MAKAVADTIGENQAGFASDTTFVTGFSHMHDSGTGGVSDSFKREEFLEPNTYSLRHWGTSQFLPSLLARMMISTNASGSSTTERRLGRRTRSRPARDTSASRWQMVSRQR